MEIIQSVGTSEEGDQNIFSKFLEIKQKNESLKANVYSQFWKHTSTSQHGMLTSFDSEKGIMRMDFLQAQVPFPKAPSDYNRQFLI